MAIYHWPDSERPREKLLQQGPSYLTDSELLALFLGSGYRGQSAVDVARYLLTEHGSLRKLLVVDAQTLATYKGIGPAKSALIIASLELGKRYLCQSITRGTQLTSPKDTENFLWAKLGDYDHEMFACLLLDSQNCVLHYEELFRGTINATSVHPREVVKLALKHNAAGIIFAHNHPSGNAEPSHADREITKRLIEALALVDIRVLDHMVVGSEGCVSFTEKGFITPL